MLIVHQLARILLDMDTLDTDRLGRAVGVLLVQADLDRALAHQGVVELADLIALGQIGVEVILPVEARPFVDLRVDRHAGAHRRSILSRVTLRSPRSILPICERSIPQAWANPSCERPSSRRRTRMAQPKPTKMPCSEDVPETRCRTP